MFIDYDTTLVINKMKTPVNAVEYLKLNSI